MWGFLAPEVLQGRNYDLKADWFLLGSLVFQILSGWTPMDMELDEEAEENGILNLSEKNYTWSCFEDKCEQLELSNPLLEFLQYTLEEDAEFRWNKDNIKSCDFFSDFHDFDELYQNDYESPVEALLLNNMEHGSIMDVVAANDFHPHVNNRIRKILCKNPTKIDPENSYVQLCPYFNSYSYIV